ncbi:hypothetical protein GCM10027591_16240 [Zhihengliuella somnathii]
MPGPGGASESLIPSASENIGQPGPATVSATDAPAEGAEVDTSDWVEADQGVFTFRYPSDWSVERDDEFGWYELEDQDGETIAHLSDGRFEGDADTAGQTWSARELAREELATNASEDQVILTTIKQRTDAEGADEDAELRVQILEPDNVEAVLGDSGSQPFWFRTDDDTAAVFTTDEDLLELDDDEQGRAEAFMASTLYQQLLEVMRSVQAKD